MSTPTSLVAVHRLRASPWLRGLDVLFWNVLLAALVVAGYVAYGTGTVTGRRNSNSVGPSKSAPVSLARARTGPTLFIAGTEEEAQEIRANLSGENAIFNAYGLPAIYDASGHPLFEYGIVIAQGSARPDLVVDQLAGLSGGPSQARSGTVRVFDVRPR